jgi:chorismate mutase/prephenate dehydratase
MPEDLAQPRAARASTQVDRELLALLNRRAALANEVGELKRAEGSPVFRPNARRRSSTACRPPTRTAEGRQRRHIWREIMSACRALEAPQRVAYLGPAGTFSEQAACSSSAPASSTCPASAFDEVFQRHGAAPPISAWCRWRTTREGVVTRSLDLLLHSPLHIVGEISLLVRHHLHAPVQFRSMDRSRASASQALAQCQGWLNKHLPSAERRAVSSNAEGARQAAGNPAWAAIAGERAGSTFGLHIAALRSRTTLSTARVSRGLPASDARGAAGFRQGLREPRRSVPNKPGAVHDILEPLKVHGVSMTRFESRPARSGQWEYYFYIDLQGHPAQPHVAAALKDLQALCAFYKVLGTYPVGE